MTNLPFFSPPGRAGRDGRRSECILYWGDSDFDRYNSDFYLGKLNAQAKNATLASLEALKSFACDPTTCRRKSLLDFFEERPAPFGERCNTCDVCVKLGTLAQEDLERDFKYMGARVMLQAIDLLHEQSASTIMALVSGSKSVEQYRYKRGITDSAAKQQIAARKEELTKKVSQASYQDLIIPMKQRGFLNEMTKSSVVNGFSVRTVSLYSIQFISIPCVSIYVLAYSKTDSTRHLSFSTLY